MERDDRKDGSGNAFSRDRKPYSSPQLTLFGQVATLTQNTSCSASSDSNVACQPGATGTMGTMASDCRLKEQIVRVGDHPAGFGLYLYHYKPAYREAHGHGRRFGVLADEVQAVLPQAVVTGQDGFLAVRYDLLGIYPALH
jgi:hypothetical protein